MDAFRQNLTVFTHALQRPYWAFWGSDPNQAMIEDFVQAIRAQRPPRVSGEDGLRAVEVVEAAISPSRAANRCACNGGRCKVGSWLTLCDRVAGRPPRS